MKTTILSHLAGAAKATSSTCTRSGRFVLTLLVVLLSSFTARATTFVTDVKLIGGSRSETTVLKDALIDDGWKFVDYDLNKGAGGDYIYLLYKMEENFEGEEHHFITDFYISNADGTAPDTRTFNGRTYHLVPIDGGTKFKNSKGDLNRGAGGATIHLYYTKDSFDDCRAVRTIVFNAREYGAVVWNGNGDEAADLNDECGGGTDYIYMHFTTADATPGFITDVKVIGASTKDLADNYIEPYVANGWICEDQNLNEGAGGDYIYLLYKIEKNTDGVNHGYVTGIFTWVHYSYDASQASFSCEKIKYGQSTYYRVPYDGDEEFKQTKGDLNSGVEGSVPIRIYYTRQLSERLGNHQALTGLYFNDVCDDGVGSVIDGDESQNRWWGYNLNDGCGADAATIYMHFNHSSVYSQTLPGDGTPWDPFLIRNNEDWETFAENVARGLDSDKCYKLCSGITTNVMVGSAERPFTGTFYGGEPLSINWTGSTINEPGAAPFHYIKGATIENVRVIGNINGANYTGGLVGYALGDETTTTTLRNCVVTANVTCTGNGGGLVGHVGSGKLVLDNCAFSGELTGFDGYAGGLVGWCSNDLTLTINNCLVGCSFTPSGNGKYHPFACKAAGSSVSATGTDNYCLNTLEQPTATGDNIISNINYTPISKEYDADKWNEDITGIDGNFYYKYSQAIAVYHNAERILDETFYFPNLPEGWVFQKGPDTYDAYKWEILSEAYGVSSWAQWHNSAFIKDTWDSPDHVNWQHARDVGLFTPSMDLSECGRVFFSYSYFFRQPSPEVCESSGWRKMSLKVCYQNNKDGAWITLEEYKGYTDEDVWWKNNRIELPNLSDVYRIGFFYNTGDETVGFSTTGWNEDHIVAIDNVRVYCMGRPTDLVVSLKSATSIELNWSAVTAAFSQWQICVDNDEEHLITVDQCSHTINNLDLTQSHTFKVRSYDDQAPDHSRWSEPATWTYDTYSISYNLNGGTVATENPTEYTPISDEFTLVNPTLVGHDFKGWTGTDVTEPATTVTIPFGSTGDRTYTANWTPFEYNITYNLDGGSSDGPLVYNTDQYVTIGPATREGYLFMGWTGTDLNEPTQIITIPTGSMGNRTYTATWKEIHEWEGSGTEADPYLITSTDQLDLLAYRVNGTHTQKANIYRDTYFKLNNDIEYSYTTNWNDPNSTETNFEMIHGFQGVLDGNGHTISGVRLHKDNLQSSVGLFAIIVGDKAIIKNLTLADSRITGRNRVGGIVGFIKKYSHVENCHVAKTVAISKITENNRAKAGGIVGFCVEGSIKGCVSEATMTIDNTYLKSDPNHIGGILGDGEKVDLINCYATNTVVSFNNEFNTYGAIAGELWRRYDEIDPQANNYYTNFTVNGTPNVTNAGIGEYNFYVGDYDDDLYMYGDVPGYQQAHTITLGDSRIDIAGTRTVYDVSGITAIGTTAMIYNNGTTSTILSGSGQTITLAVTPDEGYEVTSVTCNGTPIVPDNGVYTFTMPDEDVTINATYKLIRYSFANGELHLLRGEFNNTQDNFEDDVKNNKKDVLKVIADEGVRFTQSCATLFQDFDNCTEIDLSKVNTSAMTRSSSMFKGCTNLKKLNLTGWDMQNVEYMVGMFENCSSLRELDLSCINMNANADMKEMFSYSGTNTSVCKLTLPAGMGVTASMHLSRGYYKKEYGQTSFSGWQLLGNKDVVSGTDQDNGDTYATLPAQPSVATFVWKQMPEDFVLELPDGEDNSKTIADWDGIKTSVQLTDRVLYKDGDWNTICLPFHLGPSEIINDLGYPEIKGLETLYTYNASGQTRWDGEIDTEEGYIYRTGFEESTGTLRLYFDNSNDIYSGEPYLIKWPNDAEHPYIESPTFSGVTIDISSDEANVSKTVTSEDGKVQFIGTYSPIALTPNDGSNLFLGAGNTLYWPNAANNTDGNYYVNAFRSYFHVDLGGDPNAAIKRTILGFGDDATGVIAINNGEWTMDNEAVYDLAGRKVNSQFIIHNSQLAKGIYIVNGRKVIIK